MADLKSFAEVMPGYAEKIVKEKVGDKYQVLPLADVLGKPIIVKAVEFQDTELATISMITFSFENEDKDYVAATSGSVLLAKFKYAVEQGLLPLKGTITKEKRYYDIN
jgi:uncharacterized protein (UPF0212 family)